MAKKHKSSPPKYPTPPPSVSEEEEEEEEEEEAEEEEDEEEENSKDTSTPVTSKPSSKKPTSEANHTQNADSSEEEGDDDEDEEDEDDDADSESEKAKYIAAEIKPTQPRKQKEEEDESDNEAESVSGTDSESPTTEPNSSKPKESPTTKPNSSKPKDEQPKPKKQSTKAGSAAPSKTQPAANESSENGSKKRRRNKEPVLRVWGHDDVVRLLKGLIEFAEMGRDAQSDLTLFNEFINKSLQYKVTRNQVLDKIRRLKQKFRAQVRQEREGELAFSRPFDKAVYKLSKRAWGADYSATEANDELDVENESKAPKGDASSTEQKRDDSSKKRRKNVEERVELQSPNASKSVRKSLGFEENLQNRTVMNQVVEREAVLYPHLNEFVHSSGIVSPSGFREGELKRAFELMSPSQLKEWDKRCMKMRSKEREISMERITLAYEMTKECYDRVKSSSV